MMAVWLNMVCMAMRQNPVVEVYDRVVGFVVSGQYAKGASSRALSSSTAKREEQEERAPSLKQHQKSELLNY